jgi:glutamate synthase domain-containing protein 2
MLSFEKRNDALGTANRGNPSGSGLCTLCRADCQGKCETWMSAMYGREMLYPRDFGLVTAGSNTTNHFGVSYESLRITGRSYGAVGVPKGLTNSADDCIFPNVRIDTEFGRKVKTRSKLPILTGALGSTFVAAKYWDSLAVGAALIGIPIVVGENVVGIDQQAEIDTGRIKKAPELDRRIETYLKYHDGNGAIIVQMNVEDTQNGVAEYVIDKYGDKVILELKWGQGAKSIGGEIQVTDLEYAVFLKKRGYVVDPDPTKKDVQEAFKHHAIKSFARHSRLGYTDIDSPEDVQRSFSQHVSYLRKLGYNRITLKTGSYGMESLAMAIKFATDEELDLLTIDGSSGGTGMSPWNMMEYWGVPSVYLHSKAFEYASVLAARDNKVVDLAFAGGLAREDQIFKALALGAPFVKLVCMGRGLMIPGFLGSNIEGVIRPDRKAAVNGLWDKLPLAVAEHGSYPEEVFACYYDVQRKVGEQEMKNVPFGAVALWTFLDKTAAGLQQLMAGARKFSVREISRDDIYAANRETEKETGIPFITDQGNESALDILKR